MAVTQKQPRTPSELTEYRIAVKRLRAAKKDLSQLASGMKATAEWLAKAKSPELFMTIETQAQGPFWADKWPDSEVISNKLQSFIELKSEADRTYLLISEADRDLVPRQH